MKESNIINLDKFLEKEDTFLLLGNDPFQISFATDKILEFHKVTKEFYEYKELKNDYNRLLLSLRSLDLFYSEKIVIIKGLQSSISSEILDIFSVKRSGVILLLQTEEIKKSSQIYKRINEKIKPLNVLCYSGNLDIKKSFVRKFLKENKIFCNLEIENVLIGNLPDNICLLNNELEKIKIYLSGEKLTLSILEDFMESFQDYSKVDLVNALLVKDKESLLQQLKNFQKNSVPYMLIIRILQGYLQKLDQIFHIMNIQRVNSLEAINLVKPPVFFREKNVFNEMVKKTSKDLISDLLLELLKVEIACKKDFTGNQERVLYNYLISRVI